MSIIPLKMIIRGFAKELNEHVLYLYLNMIKAISRARNTPCPSNYEPSFVSQHGPAFALCFDKCQIYVAMETRSHNNLQALAVVYLFYISLELKLIFKLFFAFNTFHLTWLEDMKTQNLILMYAVGQTCTVSFTLQRSIFESYDFLGSYSNMWIDWLLLCQLEYYIKLAGPANVVIAIWKKIILLNLT